MRNLVLLSPLLLMLGACATAPVVLQGEFSSVTPSESAQSAQTGERVRWGGDIIMVDPKPDSTCFEVLGRNLDSSARPTTRDSNLGRFIACRSGFYDPEVFVRGRQLTVIGTVTGAERGQVGSYEYVYPRVAADAIYLWPKRPLYVEQRYDPFWGPGFGPYWGGGWWGAPTRVIIHQRPAEPSRPSKP
ncbi:MAG: Slp family lipoprotein [Dokdonella sp.]